MRYRILTAFLILTLTGCDSSIVHKLTTTIESIKAGWTEEVRNPLSILSLEEVDYRQMEEYQGLMYKVGMNDPFTGIITNQPMPNFMGQTVGSCRIEIHDGLPDGTSTCFNNHNVKVSETQFSKGQKNGVEKIWDPTTQHLVKEHHWTYNRRDGLQKEYDGKTGKPVIEFELVNGKKSGLQKSWVTLDNQSFFIKAHYTNGIKSGQWEVRDSQSRLTGTITYVNGTALSQVNQTWDDNGRLISIKRETREDSDDEWEYPEPGFVLNGAQYECKEIHYCYTTEWKMGEQLRGKFSYQKEGEVPVSYSGVPGSDGQLVKDGTEHFYTFLETGQNDEITVTWNQGVPESIQVIYGHDNPRRETTLVRDYPGLKAGFFDPNGSYGIASSKSETDTSEELDSSIVSFLKSNGYGASEEYRSAREIAKADFNRDGIDDAVVLLTIENAEMGNNSARYLVYFQGSKTGFNHVDSTFVAPSSEMALQDDSSILLTSLHHGPDDPRCCPTQQSSKKYLIQNNRIFADSDN